MYFNQNYIMSHNTWFYSKLRFQNCGFQFVASITVFAGDCSIEDRGTKRREAQEAPWSRKRNTLHSIMATEESLNNAQNSNMKQPELEISENINKTEYMQDTKIAIQKRYFDKAIQQK